jgi:hypothetical protein
MEITCIRKLKLILSKEKVHRLSRAIELISLSERGLRSEIDKPPRTDIPGGFGAVRYRRWTHHRQ